jgi:hypothetical protein
LGRFKIDMVEKIDNSILTDKGPIYKKNSFWKEKFKIRCLRNQLEFYRA